MFHRTLLFIVKETKKTKSELIEIDLIVSETDPVPWIKNIKQSYFINIVLNYIMTEKLFQLLNAYAVGCNH